MDYRFTFSDPSNGVVATQKLLQMTKKYKSVKHAFYAFRRHISSVMELPLSYVTQFSKMEELNNGK